LVFLVAVDDGSAVAAMPLEHLHLVAVGVLHEEEARHQRALAHELLDRVGIETGFGEAVVLGVEIVDGDCDVPVAVA